MNVCMKKKFSSFFLSLLFMNPFTQIHAQHQRADAVKWSVVAELPTLAGMQKQLGVAGPFAGVSNNVLLIAGGSNFPAAKPWEGGKKVYYDDVYVLQKNNDNTFSWMATIPLHLKQKIAYGASVTVDDGVVCIGGETETGYSNEVFLLKWNAGQKNITPNSLPPLPVALANASATAIGKTIYVAGGEDAKHALNNFFSLDLSETSPQWKVLPALPVAMSHSVAVAQSNGKNECIYVIGGRSKTASGISDLHNTVFCYDPALNSWKQLNNIYDGVQTTNLSASNAVAYGKDCILVIAGDKGNIFHQIETYNANIAAETTDTAKQRLQNEKLQLLTHHPGFSRDVLEYDTKKDNWKKVGELPGYGPVTTTAVKWDDAVFIPGGEIKPGVRTAEVLMGEPR